MDPATTYWKLVLLAAGFLLGAWPAWAQSQVYHSPGDDGLPGASLQELPSGLPATVHLYLDAGSTPSSNTPCFQGDGDEICGYLIELFGPAVTIQSFVPSGDVIFGPTPSARIKLTGGDFENGTLGVVKIGDLVVQAPEEVSTHLLARLDVVTSALTRDDATQDEVIIGLPEPSPSLLICSGVMLLVLLHSARTRQQHVRPRSLFSRSICLGVLCVTVVSMASSAWSRPVSLGWRDPDANPIALFSTEFAEARTQGDEAIIRITILPDLDFAFEDIDSVSTSLWLEDAAGTPLVHTTPTGTDSWDIEARPSVFGTTQLTSEGPIGITHACPPGPNPPPPGCWHQSYDIEIALTALVDNAPAVYWRSGETIVVNQLGQAGPDSEAAGLRLPFVVNPPTSGLHFEDYVTITGVSDSGSLALHPDGHALYVSSGDSGRISALSLDPATGSPTFLSQQGISEGLPLSGAGPIVVTTDGFVIVGSSSAIVTFEIDPLSGDLGLASSAPTVNPVTSLALSVDGQFLYVASSASPAQGRLETYERSGMDLVLRQDLGEEPTLAGVRHIALSGDGSHLYSASTAGILSLFQIQLDPGEGAGTLSLVHGRDPGISIGSLDFLLPLSDPNGGLLHAASESSDGLGLIRSDPSYAATLLSNIDDGTGPITGLADPGTLALDTDGTRLYVHASAQRQILVFLRDPQDASLLFLEALPFADIPAPSSPTAATTLIVSEPDLYVLNFENGTLHHYSIDRDFDNVPVPLDNCPDTSNPLQLDRGGAVADPGLASAPPDGWGDACQCADADDDGSFSIADVTAFREALVGSVKLSAAAQQRCPSGACDLLSLVLTQRAIHGLAPGIPVACGTSDPRDEDADLFSAALDCDDSNPEAYPGSTEACDDIDRDCDGGRRGVDVVGCTTLFADRDGDGSASHFAPSSCLCSDAPTGVFSAIEWGDDCNDLDPEIGPGAVEIECDGIDNDCEATTRDARPLSIPVVERPSACHTEPREYGECFADRTTLFDGPNSQGRYWDPWLDSTSDGCSGVPDEIPTTSVTYIFGATGLNGEEIAQVDLPCNNHDRCYGTCGKTKAECDDEFLADMVDVCVSGGNIADQTICVDTAGIYYLGVSGSLREQGYLYGQCVACECGRTECD
jgi:6-phosphogluconolactonase (cycloisomerase 2 family)